MTVTTHANTQATTVRTRTKVVKRKKTNNTKHTKRVQFHQVQIREYEIVLGDHPSCSKGLPISLGWEYQTPPHAQCSVEDYEQDKSLRQDPLMGKRTMKQMKIAPAIRETWLRGLGHYSDEELCAAEKEVRRIRLRRKKTNKERIRVEVSPAVSITE